MSKAGRPRGRKYPIKEQVHVTETMHAEIEFWSKQKGIDTPDFMREAIQRHIDLMREWQETSEPVTILQVNHRHTR